MFYFHCLVPKLATHFVKPIIAGIIMGRKRKNDPRWRQSSSRDLVQAAAAYAQIEHEGQTLKVARGAYFGGHLKPVAQAMHSQDERVVAFLHDVIEHYVKNLLGEKPDPVAEEAAIKSKLQEIEKYFILCRQDIRHLIPHLDDLTKRRGDSYDVYIQKLIRNAKARKASGMSEAQAYISIKVKMADLRHNRDDNRNLPFNDRTPKDNERLKRYDDSIALLDKEFPTIELLYDPRRALERRKEMEDKKRGIRQKPDGTIGRPKGKSRPPNRRRDRDKRDGYFL